MKTGIEFIGQHLRIVMTPEDDYDRQVLEAIAEQHQINHKYGATYFSRERWTKPKPGDALEGPVPGAVKLTWDHEPNCVDWTDRYRGKGGCSCSPAEDKLRRDLLVFENQYGGLYIRGVTETATKVQEPSE